MMRKSLARWELRRKGGFLHFVLKWGVGIFSAVFLVCAVVSTFLSNWLFNRRMAQAGMHIELRLADLVPFIPRLLVLVVGGGVVFAIVLWFYMEVAYRRAQSSARAQPAAAADAVGFAAVAAEPQAVGRLKKDFGNDLRRSSRSNG